MGKRQVDGQKRHDGFSKSDGKETHQLRMVVIHHPMIYGGVFFCTSKWWISHRISEVSTV